MKDAKKGLYSSKIRIFLCLINYFFLISIFLPAFGRPAGGGDLIYLEGGEHFSDGRGNWVSVRYGTHTYEYNQPIYICDQRGFTD